MTDLSAFAAHINQEQAMALHLAVTGTAAIRLKECMEKAANTILPLVPASVDVTIAANWAGK